MTRRLNDATVVPWLEACQLSPDPTGRAWGGRFGPYQAEVTVLLDGAGKICFDDRIRVVRKTSSNLGDAENLVVLAAVVRLLSVGYPPECIVLEKSFKLGRANGGYLDIQVLGPDGRTYLMIECKTSGQEYETAVVSLKEKPDSQLMSYYVQDRRTQHCALLSARILAGQVNFAFVRFVTSSLAGDTMAEVFDSWDGSLLSTGLFSDSYEIDEVPLRIQDLREMDLSQSNALLNEFKEILRRHAVSDHPNSFNKLFNLFLCKIVDEEKLDLSERAEFQWRVQERPEDVMARLTELYHQGMKHFLQIETLGAPIKNLELARNEASSVAREALSSAIDQLKKFGSQEFDFIEVYDERTWDRNAAIVRDVVQLLESIRLRYSARHGSLGLFFEKLLNTGLKQEVGQFFTPPPIAQFIVNSLPVDEIVTRKISDGTINFLPYAIDFAAGSGHFVTEYLHRIGALLQELQDRGDGSFKTKQQLNKAGEWTKDYSWAGEFAYGIELDYRLAKTAKIATFLNGDGNAKIIHGDGLGNFGTYSPYLQAGGVFSAGANRSDRDLSRFDVVIANPPFAVKDFARTVERGYESFSLWSELSDKDQSIESIFMERAAQLLRPNGVVGIIMPSSFLTNSGIEAHARQLMLETFRVVALVDLGADVFVATGTPTSVLFLQKRELSKARRYQRAIQKFLDDGTDVSLDGVDGSLSVAVEEIHGLDPQQYLADLRQPGQSSSACLKATYESLAHRRGASREDLDKKERRIQSQTRDLEARRLLAHLLVRGEKVGLVRAPTGKSAKQKFLGYKISDRRRHEGIQILSDSGVIDTPLFNSVEPMDADKVAWMIHELFMGRIPEKEYPFSEIVELVDIIQIGKPDFNWEIELESGDPGPVMACPSVALGSVIDLRIGGTPSTEVSGYFGGEHLWVSVSDLNDGVVTATKRTITDSGIENSSVKKVPAGALLVSFKLTIGRIGFAGSDLYTNEAVAALIPKDERLLPSENLHALFRLFAKEILGTAPARAKKIGKSMNTGLLNSVRIPDLPDSDWALIKAAANDFNLGLDERRERVWSLIWQGGYQAQ